MNDNDFKRRIQIFATVALLTISSYNISNKIIDNHQEFDNSIITEQNIDDLSDYVLQGLCKVEDKYLLTAYDYNHENNSIIYVLDEDLKHYKIKELDTTSHVGGITYDPNNELVWITDIDGTVSAYSKEEVLGYKYNIESKYKNIYVGDELDSFFGVCSAAYITYNDNKLYIGNFNTKGNTIIKEYDLLYNGMIDKTKYKKIKISSFIQGIAFYEKDDKKYLIVSTSYGRYFRSKLQIFDAKTLEKIKDINTKEMMEEVIIDDDKLVTLYESNAKIYSDNNKEADIIISDINKLLTKK